jgi:aminoacrylate hydrolase
MPLIATPAGEIFAEVTGAGAPVVMVPGLGGRGQFWNAQREALSPHFRLLVQDHRGVGRSPRGPAAASIAEMAADVLAVMDALGIARAQFVGHSTGGAIGQHIAVHAPERIDRLVLSGTWAGPDPLFLKLFETRRTILKACGPEVYLMTGTVLATPGWYLQTQYAQSKSFLSDRVRDFPGLETELTRIAAVMAHDLRAKVGRIRHPTLVIGARDDQITPPGFSEELARLIPDAALHILPEGGHFCPMTVPDPYNRILLDFLRRPS